jgi:site-specific DNA-cytosine methylase
MARLLSCQSPRTKHPKVACSRLQSSFGVWVGVMLSVHRPVQVPEGSEGKNALAQRPPSVRSRLSSVQCSSDGIVTQNVVTSRAVIESMVVYEQDNGKTLDYNGQALTLRAGQYVDQHAVRTKHPKLDRLFSVREYARLQAIPDQCVCTGVCTVVESGGAPTNDWVGCFGFCSCRFFGSVPAQFRMIGNAVPVPVVEAFGLMLLKARKMVDAKSAKRVRPELP